MEELKIFNSPQFGEIRTAGTRENPLFCLVDVCKVLDLSPSKVAQRISKDVLSKYPLETTGGTQVVNFVNEDGLYDVILDSRKPQAKAFRKWVTSEVLPSIRKTGSYAVQPQTPQTYLEALEALVASEKEKQRLECERKSLEEKNAKLQPKADFADAAFRAEGRVDIGQAAKILGLPFGRNTLFKKLREDGIFFSDRNEPKQRYIDAGYFILTQLPPIHRENHPDIIPVKVLCEQKGLAYINKMYGNGNTTNMLTGRRESWQRIG